MKIYDKNELNEYYQSLTYDDISLVPTEISRIKSRNEVDTSAEFLQEKLLLPVISSPMESVTGLDMAKVDLTTTDILARSMILRLRHFVKNYKVPVRVAKRGDDVFLIKLEDTDPPQLIE